MIMIAPKLVTMMRLPRPMSIRLSILAHRELRVSMDDKDHRVFRVHGDLMENMVYLDHLVTLERL